MLAFADTHLYFTFTFYREVLKEKTLTSQTIEKHPYFPFLFAKSEVFGNKFVIFMNIWFRSRTEI